MIRRAKDYLTGESFMLVETDAGWWETTPAPADLARYYPEVYYGKSGQRRFPRLIEWMQTALCRRRAQQVTKTAGGRGWVLDAGCGPGHLLAQFRTLGWKTLGTEADERAAAIPRANHGLEVLTDDVSDLRFPDSTFDAVVSWHTLEHMRQPAQTLDQIARLLRPGGVFLVSVPNFSSPEAQANPAAWFHLEVPRHLCHFPAAVLREHLERRGLKILRESYWTPEYDAISLVQTWQNRLGLPQNLLYLMLKSAPDSGASVASFAQRSGAVMLGVVFLPCALVVSWWRAWRKNGGVVTFLARKL